MATATHPPCLHQPPDGGPLRPSTRQAHTHPSPASANMAGQERLRDSCPALFTKSQETLTFLMLLVYCFIAIFSTVLSKPKKDLISKLADCSKQVQSSFSGWTCR